MIEKVIRRIRTRRGQTQVEFARELGVRHSAVSRYEAGKLSPSRSIMLLLLQLAETDEEKQPLREALGETVEPDNPIEEVRQFAGMSPAQFARAIGCAESDLVRFGSGEKDLPLAVLDRLKTLAVKAGRADLAIILSSDEWRVRRMLHPGETLISVGEPAATASEKEKWCKLLEEILDSGEEDAIVAVQHNLMVFGRYVRSKRTQGKKKLG